MIRGWGKPLAIVTLYALAVSGCGGSSINVSTGVRDCANGFDPALPVDVNVPTFTVSTNLDQTGFRTFFAAIQPAATQSSGSGPAGQDQSAADDVGALSQQYLNYAPASQYKGYTQVRNASDFINNEIGIGDVGNFNTGRQYIVTCIGQGTAAGYNNTAVTLRDISTGSDPNAADSSDTAWNYVVRWSYSPNPPSGSPNVTRVVAGINTNTSIASIYNPTTFSASGFNQPESVIYGFTTDNYQNDQNAQLTLNLTREYVTGSNRDTWAMASESTDSTQTTAQQQTSPPTFSFLGKQVRCVRMVIDYTTNKVDVYYSSNAPVLNTSTNTGTGAYSGSCLDSSISPNFSYDADPNNYPNR